MDRPNIKTAQDVVPMLYGYTTPEIKRHDGWTKIGYTERNVEERIKEQVNTADVEWKLEWKGNAIYEDGSAEFFTDKDFHKYLRKLGVEQEKDKNNEWFKISGTESRDKFYKFRETRGLLKLDSSAMPYKLRSEQEEAVEKTLSYINEGKGDKFLWNAKPRFGKTLAVYDFCKRLDAQKVLVVTNRPAIANSWYSDYVQFLGKESGYTFVSSTESLKDKEFVCSRKDYLDSITRLDSENSKKIIQFVSLQDLKGSKYFTSKKGGADKLKEIRDMEWDLLVIDEAHEGVDTFKTEVAFENIVRKFTLHLSGTPFKAIANMTFPEGAIFNWTYADEQKAKRNWDISQEEENPYEVLPKLNMYTYQMSEIISDEIKKGIELDGEVEEYAFDLNEFFAVDGNGVFKYKKSVDKFLDALTKQEKYPFSTAELREEIKHSFWLLDRVDSVKALATKLKEHEVFKDYEVIVAAGDGKLDDFDETEKSYDKVVNAIKKYDKTITLSVGQLTTGVTIPEWTAVLMLSNVKSPALYMQAAFRSQNPCLFQNGAKFKRKENAYVFDFDPARTLTIFEEFANDLSVDTSQGRGDLEKRKENIRELLNFFPVIGEDENGKLIELDAEKVLIVPRKIRSLEVVRRGFMSNFLFQNIGNIFSAPTVVKEILGKLELVKDNKKLDALGKNTKDDLYINDDGEVEISEDIVVSKSEEIFGDKIFADSEEVKTQIDSLTTGTENNSSDTKINKFKEDVSDIIIKGTIEEYDKSNETTLKAREKERLEKKLKEEFSKEFDKEHELHKIKVNNIEYERDEKLKDCGIAKETRDEIKGLYEEKINSELNDWHSKVGELVKNFEENTKSETIRHFEESKAKEEKKDIEEGIRDHLRGFARTIPAFLMAYGDKDVSLEKFEKIMPEDVFKEVTSITVDEFKFLRDGGPYTDEETKEEKYYEGNLFDPVVFNDSIKEFMRLKDKLSNYFDEKNKEDIFDYIPQQKTNQVFTPKRIVKMMVDMLEEENPGCYDDPNKTFIDLYMKSGLYIAEIVKRLYNSEKIKKIYPDDNERLRHIFAKQVFGLAPTEIIYRIVLSYVLGFSKEISIEKHNLKKLDALPYAKEGTLEEKLDEIFN